MCRSAWQIRFASSLAVLLLMSGCASSGSASPETSAQHALCPPDLTPSCIEYNGQKLRCSCSSREDLREILEPTNQSLH